MKEAITEQPIEVVEIKWQDYLDKIPVPHYLSSDHPVMYKRYESGKETVEGKCVFISRDPKVSQRKHVNYVSEIECFEQFFYLLGAAWNAGRIRRIATGKNKQLAYKLGKTFIKELLEPDYKYYDIYGEVLSSKGDLEKCLFTVSREGKIIAQTIVHAIELADFKD